MIRSARASADDVPDGDPHELARTICLRQLTAAPRTRAQLATVLRRKGVAASVAAEVLSRFEDVRLVDDAAFAESYVTSRRASGLSRRALGHELRSKGVAGEVVEQAMESVDPEAEVETARALVARKLPSTRSVPLAARVRRLVGMLARKGYPGGLSLRVVREALAAEAELNSLERALVDLDIDLSDAARRGE